MATQHVLMIGSLKTRETAAIGGPRDEPFTEEANALNQRHYETCYLQYFGKPANGDYTPNKRYIWWSQEQDPLEG